MAEKHTFTHVDRESFGTAVPLTMGGRIMTEAKTPPVIFNPLNRNDGAGAQAGRCATCGSAGCFQGTGGGSTGCPFGRAIPDIHAELSVAEDVLKEAFSLLQRLAPERAEAVKGKLQEQADPDINTRLPFLIFAALAQLVPQRAAAMKAQFDDRMREAFKISYASGPMGDIYGRICPETLCEQTCTTNDSGHGAITIKKNEAAVWDYAWEAGFLQPISPETERDETVLVVGSGFAGYAAAERLREQGFKVALVDRNEAPGEPGHAQILGYKTLQERFNRHYDRLRASGVTIETGVNVGADGEDLVSLAKRFNARSAVLATGTPKAKWPGLQGDAAGDVFAWSDYTKYQQRADRTGEAVPALRNMQGKSLVVIGTGDTAVDCVRTAILQGAAEVTLVSRHDKVKAEDIGAWDAMMKEAKGAGVEVKVQNWMAPAEAMHAEGGGYTLRGANTQAGYEGESVDLRADAITYAIGNEAEGRELLGIPLDPDARADVALPQSIRIKKGGTLDVAGVPRHIADKSHILGTGAGYVGQISDVFVFAAGQSVRGDSLAATCGRDGVDIAHWIGELADQNFAPLVPST